MSRSTVKLNLEDDKELDDVSLWLDRFLSAGTASYVESSLEGLLSWSRSTRSSLNQEDWSRDSLAALVLVVQTAHHNTIELDKETGSQLIALQILSQLITVCRDEWLVSVLFELSFVAALLDVSCSQQSTTATLTRVLALETIELLSKRRSTDKKTRTQLLQSNGLVRLAELFGSDSGPVSLAMLELAVTIVEWPAVARNWMFVDVPTTLLTTFVKYDDDFMMGGTITLSTTHGVRIQAIHILTRMLSQDASFAILLLETTPNLYALLPCLDLRLAAEYRDPLLIAKRNKTESSTCAKNSKDDLDALLQSGLKDKASTTINSSIPEIPPQPILSALEENLIIAVMEFWAVVLQGANKQTPDVISTREPPSAWTKHEPMGRMLWDMALLTSTPPPITTSAAHPHSSSSTPSLAPNVYYPCAMPGADLQAKALVHCAFFWNNSEWLTSCLDRLLYLTCTGSGAQAKSLVERFQISQNAVYLLRETLSLEAAQELLLATKVATSSSSSNDKPSAVRKLVYTILENLESSPSQSEGTVTLLKRDMSVNSNSIDGDADSRVVFLSGATSALLVLLHNNEASKTLLMQLEPTLLPQLLSFLQSSNSIGKDRRKLVVEIVMHFLVRWVDEAPDVMRALLQLPLTSIIVSQLSGDSDGVRHPTEVQALVWIFLGMALDQIMISQPERILSNTSNSMDWGGWTSAAIVDTFKSRGISKVIQNLQLYENGLPWLEKCQPEQHLHQVWYKQVVLRIRKRLVQAVLKQAGTSESNHGDESEEELGSTAWNSLRSSSKSLSVLVQQQSNELEELRKQLSDARKTLLNQEQQLESWKRRVESTPTQLDEMLSEYTSQVSDLKALLESRNETITQLQGNQNREMESRDEELSQLRRELDESREELEESRRERDALHNELEGLSKGYSILEDDYTKLQQRSSTVNSTRVLEDSVERQTNESKEVTALRMDNARLKQDVKSAEEWMSTAYERLNKMQQENVELHSRLQSSQTTSNIDKTYHGNYQNQNDFQSRIEELQRTMSEQEEDARVIIAEWQEAHTSSEGTIQELQGKVSTLDEERLSLLARIEDLELQLSTLDDKAKIVDLKSQIEELQRALLEQEEEARVAMSGWQEAHAASEGTVQELEGKATTLEEERVSLQTRIDDLERQLCTLNDTTMIVDLESRIEELQRSLREKEEETQIIISSWQEAHAASEGTVQELQGKATTLEEERVSLQARIDDLEGQLSTLNDTAIIVDLESRIEELQRFLLEKEEEAKIVISGLQMAHSATVQELQGRASALEDERMSLQARIKDFERQLSTLDDDTTKIVDLESRIEELQRALLEQEEEAQVAIAGWQEAHAASEGAIQELQGKVWLLDEERLSLRARIEDLERQLSALNDTAKIVDLESQIKELQNTLLEQEEEARMDISGWQEAHTVSEGTINELQGKVSTLDEERISLQARVDDLESQLSTLNDTTKIVDLERTIKELQQSLLEQEKEAHVAILGWQEAHAASEDSLKELQRKVATLDKERVSHQARIDDLERQLATIDDTSKTVDLESQIEELQRALLEQEEESQISIAGWQEAHTASEGTIQELQGEVSTLDKERVSLQARIDDLERQIEQLQKTSLEREEEARAAILGWQEAHTVSEGTVHELQSNAKSQEDERISLEARIDDFKRQLCTLNDTTKIVDLESQIEELQRSLLEKDQEAQVAQVTISDWQKAHAASEGSLKELQGKATALEEEREALHARIDDLERRISALNDETKIVDLERRIDDLYQSLSEQEKEAHVAIVGWQEAHAASERTVHELQEKATTLEDDRMSLLSRIGDMEHQLFTLKDTNNNIVLERKVEELQRTLLEQEEEARVVISGLQEAHTASNGLVKELQSRTATQEDDRMSLQARIDDLESQIGELQQTLSEQEKAHAASEDSLKELQEKAATQKEERMSLQATVDDLQRRLSTLNDSTIVNLERQIEELQHTLLEQEEEAQVAISERQEAHTASEDKVYELQGKASILEDERVSLLSRIGDLEHQLSTLNDSTKIVDLERENVELQQTLLERGEEARVYILGCQEAHAAYEGTVQELQGKATTLEEERVSLQARIDDLERELSTLNDTTMIVDLESRIEELQRSLSEQEEEAQVAISEWQEAHTVSEGLIHELQGRATSHEGERILLKAIIDDLECQLSSLNDTTKIVDLEDKIEELQRSFLEKEEEAKVAISGLQMTHSATVQELQGRASALEEERMSLQARNKDLERQLSALDDSTKIVDLESRIEELQRASLEQEEEARDAILGRQEVHAASEDTFQELQGKVSALDAERVSLQARIDDLVRQLSTLDDTTKIVNLESRIEQLQRTLLEQQEEARFAKSKEEAELVFRIEELKHTMFEQEKETNEAINQWQLAHASSEARNFELQQLIDLHDNEIKDSSARIIDLELQAELNCVARSELETHLVDLKNQLRLSQEKIDELESELEHQLRDANDAIREWESRCLELQHGEMPSDELMVSLFDELDFKRKLLGSLMVGLGADEKTSTVETPNSYEAVKTKLSELSSSLFVTTSLLLEYCSSSKNIFVQLKRKLSETIAEINLTKVNSAASDNIAVDSSQTMRNREIELELKGPRTLPLDEVENLVDDLRHSVDELLLDLKTMENEKIRLKDLVRELEEDVRTAEDVMRMHVLNESSDRAVNLIVETLQKENEDLRALLEAERSALNSEKDTRRVVEDEVRRLHVDFASLVGLHQSVDSHSGITQRASQARDEIHQIVQNEIDLLKDALTAALDEISRERAIACNAEERASKSILQASMYEQEIVTCKSDMKLLMEKMDEMRSAESTLREAFEYRFCTLQNETVSLRRHHAVSLDKLKNELKYLSHEKERLLEALKVSEYNKEMLLQASASNTNVPFSTDIFAEVTNLRKEKAELLILMSDEASRYEYRLRETQAAGKALSDANLIMERKLRAEAEAALESIKTEMSCLSSENHNSLERSVDIAEQMRASELYQENARLHSTLLSVSEENEQLREQVESLQLEGRDQLEELREECHRAKARLSELNRVSRVDADVEAEIARYRASKCDTAPSDDGRDDAEKTEMHHHGSTLRQLSTLIQEQNLRIKESTAAYSALATEHDELLVVLAESHTIQTSLKQALERTGGSEAVEDALRAAEAMATAQCCVRMDNRTSV